MSLFLNEKSALSSYILLVSLLYELVGPTQPAGHATVDGQNFATVDMVNP